MTIIPIQNNSHKTLTGQISLMSLKLVYIYSHETQILDSMVDFIFPFFKSYILAYYQHILFRKSK